MQKHFSWYSQGLSNSAEFRKQVHFLKTAKEAKAYIEDFFKIY
jgi:tRNA-dihydrouridine synthase